MRILWLASAAVLSTLVLGPASSAFGQAPRQAVQEGRFQLTSVQTAQDFQDILRSIRLITESTGVSGDAAPPAIQIRGTAEQVALTAWLIKQLDRPAGAPVSPVGAEYKGLTDPDGQGGTEDEVARVYFLKNVPTVQDFQEIVNAIRTTSEVRRVTPYNAGRALVFRGTPEQGAMVEWLAGELTRPSDQAQGGEPRSYRLASDDVTQVLRVKNARTVQDFQEIANDIRTIPEIRRLFTFNTGRAIVARGTPNQLAMAAWLLKQLDQSSTPANASQEYREPGASDDVTQVFYLPPGESVQQFQQNAGAIRNALGIRRIFTYNAIRAISIRGSESQLALAGKMVEDLGK